MTEQEQIIIIKSMAEEPDDSVVAAYLHLAGSAILNKAYPYVQDHSFLDVPEKYRQLQIQITVYLLNQRGAEGEISHTEGGISRLYENSNTVSSAYLAKYLSAVTPFCGVPKREVLQDEEEVTP